MDIMYNSLKKTSASNTFGIREHDDSNEIHFDTFRSFYYPHFPSEVTSNVDVKILYTEIRSVIKGSLGALASANGRLSKSQYTALSTSRGSELSSPMRELIYTAYEKYEQMKGVRKEFDMEDFIYFLYSGMERFGFHGRPCTSVFVDEVQDLSAAQIALFRFCCPNLAGFVMAGDTAQTISEGVGFRFEALKDVFFHQFLRGLPPIEAKNLTPHVWELTQNFRTHNGVLFIARKIVEMIIHFFPHSIDRMKPESSLVFGPKPIFLESQPGGDNLIAQLFNDSGAQTMVDFGAEQVILVRDENAKELIKAKSGQNALVITALESKGMEFDDVMIVNFFSSSPFKNEWRVIENFSSSDSDVITSSSRRRFDPMKHGILNTELKMLYVLVTRAKKRLIIADDDPCARRPMLDLLLSEGLIEMKYLDDDIRALFNGQSTSDEWIQKGDAFMSKRQYSNAKHCYGKGGDTFKEQHASASFFEQEGDRLTATDSKTSKECYLQSSELFRGLNKLSGAIRCYEKAKEYEQAAWIYESMNRWYDAGVCYEKVPTLGKASMVYWKCYAIPEALRCAYACHEYRTAIEELRRIPQHLQPVDYCKLMTECARKGALYFHRKKQLQEMMSCISSFPSTDSKRDFLKQYKYFDQVLDIELADECFENAAKIYLEMFEFKKASHFFHKAGCHRQARDNAIVAVRQSCLDSDRLRLKSQYSGEDIEEMRTMLQPSMRQSHDSSNDITLLELSLIESVASTNTDLAVELMRKTVSSTSKFSRLQLLAIFRAIDLLGTQIAIRWLEYWESIICLEKQLNIILPSLEKSISSQALSLLDRGNIDECAAFFEGKLTTKGFVSSVLLCAIPCTKVMFDICDESENRKSLTMTVSAFATVAAAYFRAELKTSCSALSRYLIGQLESISKLTPPAYIKNLEKDDNQPIMVTTKGRLELLVPLLQVLRVEEDKSTYNIAVTKLANLCFTEYSFLEDAKKVSEARISGGVVGECLKHFLTRFYNTKLRADMIVRCLLISELVGSTEEVATRLEKVCTNELRQRGKENEIDFRKLLVAAFLWEKSEHIPPNYELGPFLYSLDQGFTALDNDCWKGTIASCVYGAQLPVTAKQKDGCISPQLFLKLIEKYVVLTSSIRKNYTNVILPQSLFEDVLCRCNKAYCNDILSCDSSRASNDREKYSCELARRIFSLLESILGETPPSSYFAWFQANSISPLREEDVNLQSAIFVLRTITLLKTIIVNFTDLKLYDRYNKLSGKFDILSTLLDVLPTNLRKKLKTKTLKSTDLLFFRSIQNTLRDPLVVFNAKPVSPFNSFIRKFKLLPKWIVVDSREYSISSVDEKPGAAASSTIPATEEVEEEEVVLESQAVEVSVIEEGRKEAEQTTLPPAKKEFPTPKMAYILKKRLKNARLRISNLNETEKFQRTTERQLVEIGTNRFEPNSTFYLNEVCPRLLVFAKLDLQVERFKSRADDEDVEIIDTLIVSQNTLQTAVENLNIRSPLPDTEEIKAALEKAEKIFEELHQFMSSELISERIHAADEREVKREREQKKGRLQSEKSAAGNKSARANNNNPPEKKKLQGSATSKNSKVKK